MIEPGEDDVLRMNMSLLEDVIPINVSVKDLKVCTKTGKDIISNVNLKFKSGQVVGIMGSSGSGKTTLLNALCGRSSADLIKGEILFNNSDAMLFHKNRMTAYVQQNDHLMPYLTVRECLNYTAELRLGSLSQKEKYRTVQDVILELGLKDCADTIIGDDWRKGISGGERRRVSVAVQLLVNPSLIFLDEPTTDSFTANNLIKTLVDLARRGRTVFISIHQPRSDIYQLFDSLVLLSQGRMIYSGPGGNQMINYFDKLGYHVPMNTNPADFFIDVVSVDTRDEIREKETVEAVQFLIKEWEKEEKARYSEEMTHAGGVSEDGKVEPILDDNQEQQLMITKSALKVNYFQQTWVLFRRAITNLKRDNLAVWGNLFEVLLFGSLLGAIFYNLSPDLPGVLSRRSALYIVASMQTYLMLIFIIYKLSNDMKVYDRERADNMYSTIPYMIAQFFSSLPFNILFPLIYSSIMIKYFMLGLRTDDLGLHFSRFFLANLVEQLIVVSFSYFCISIFRDFALASLLGNSLYTFFSFSTGFFQQLDSAPVYVRWIQKISFLTYQYRILAANEFSNNEYACKSEYPQCYGNVILNQLGVKVDDFDEPFLAMCIIFLVFWILAAIILMIKPPQSVEHAKTISKSSTDAHLEMHNRNQSMSKTTKAARVTVELKNVTVELVKKNLKSTHKSKTTGKVLLDKVSARFPSKSLSIIIGGSGTGKSTLLSILAARSLNYGEMTKVKKSGDMLFDGTKKERRSEINQICAFVRQDDASLLPALTARETLNFQAQLRLPRTWSYLEKQGRAEEILGMLGLRHCADTVVGSETLKGLSGGEKRRLSIGVQILTDPSILVIDEPTSGLDAFTANHIMMSLKDMAEAGRTIICSIHQPRSDLFPIFDNLMILTNGGRVAYSGPRPDLFPFFESIGLKLPDHTNPCDYLLDICSIDLRSADAETESKIRVEKILAKWNERREEKSVTPMSSSEFSIAEEEDEVRRVQAPFHIAFPILVNRSILNTRRQPILLFSRIMQVVALGLIQALFYARQGDGQVSVQNKLGVIQQTLATFFVGLLNCVAVFPAEKDILLRERADGIYSVGAYFLAYCLIEIPVGIISSIIYALLVVPLIGLTFTAETYWSATYAVFCLVATGESFGIGFCSLIEHIGFSISIANSVLGIFVVMSGIMSSKMPKFLDELNHISPIPYLTRLLTVNEFNSKSVITCTEVEKMSQTCFYTNGTQVLSQLTSNDQFTFDEDCKLLYFGISLLLLLLFRIGSFLILKSSAH